MAAAEEAGAEIAWHGLAVDDEAQLEHAMRTGLATADVLLTSTGSPQVDGPHGPTTQRIGTLPDLARALTRADTIGCE